MFRWLLAASLPLALLFASAPALALDKFARIEVQRQVAQFWVERANLSAMTTEQMQRTNMRVETNGDRPLRGAKMIAGGPPTIRRVHEATLRLEPIKKYKRKTQVGGLIGHLGNGNGNGNNSNFGRIFGNAPGGNFNFRGLREGAKPFRLSL